MVLWPHSGISVDDKITPRVTNTEKIVAFLVHLGVEVSIWWTHHTCFSICDCSSLSWKKVGLNYLCLQCLDCVCFVCKFWIYTTVNLHKLASVCLRCACVALSGIHLQSSGLLWSVYTRSNEHSLCPPWSDELQLFIISLLQTWWDNFPSLKHTCVKYPLYWISECMHTHWSSVLRGLSVVPQQIDAFVLFLTLSSSNFSLHIHAPLLTLTVSYVVLLCLSVCTYVLVSVGSCRQHMCATVRTGLFCLRDSPGCHACLRQRVASDHMDLNAAHATSVV